MSEFYVKHRTARETSGSGYCPPDLPWTYDGPFDSYAEAKAHWDKIVPNWQVGCVVTKCEHCGEFKRSSVSPSKPVARPEGEKADLAAATDSPRTCGGCGAASGQDHASSCNGSWS